MHHFYPPLSSLFLYLGLSYFLFILNCSFNLFLSLLFAHVSPLPFLQPFSLFPIDSILSFSANVPPLILFMSVILWACPAVLLMLAVEHPNTCNFDSVNMLGLGRLPQTPDIWCYLSGGAPESVSAVDAGRLPDELRRHVMQLALSQWCQKMLFWIGSWPY